MVILLSVLISFAVCRVHHGIVNLYFRVVNS